MDFPKTVAGVSITSAGAIVGLSLDASSSDRRLKRNIQKVSPRPLHRSLPFKLAARLAKLERAA